MTLTLLTFAQARETFGPSGQQLEVLPGDTPRSLILRHFPEADLSRLRPALDESFVDWDSPLLDARELALIPPVSGG